MQQIARFQKQAARKANTRVTYWYKMWYRFLCSMVWSAPPAIVLTH